MVCLVAHLEGGDALLALLLHVARLALRVLQATLGALEGGVQADGLALEVRVRLDLRVRRQREDGRFDIILKRQTFSKINSKKTTGLINI